MQKKVVFRLEKCPEPEIPNILGTYLFEASIHALYFLPREICCPDQILKMCSDQKGRDLLILIKQNGSLIKHI